MLDINQEQLPNNIALALAATQFIKMKLPTVWAKVEKYSEFIPCILGIGAAFLLPHANMSDTNVAFSGGFSGFVGSMIYKYLFKKPDAPK